MITMVLRPGGIQFQANFIEVLVQINAKHHLFGGRHFAFLQDSYLNTDRFALTISVIARSRDCTHPGE